jgi:hypothetical protein
VQACASSVQALLRDRFTRRPSSLFSLFFPEIISGDPLFSAGNPGSRAIATGKNSNEPHCYPLFSILIKIAHYFIDFRTPSIPLSPATARHGRAGPPVFAENLQALAIPLRSSRAVLTTVAYSSVIPMTDY